RRGSRSAQRGHDPTGRGRPDRGSLLLHDWPHLDPAAHAGRRDPRGQLDSGVEVVGLEEQVAAYRLLELDEWTVGGQRLAVLHPHGGRRLWGPHSDAWADAVGLVDRLVGAVDRL